MKKSALFLLEVCTVIVFTGFEVALNIPNDTGNSLNSFDRNIFRQETVGACSAVSSQPSITAFIHYSTRRGEGGHETLQADGN